MSRNIRIVLVLLAAATVVPAVGLPAGAASPFIDPAQPPPVKVAAEPSAKPGAGPEISPENGEICGSRWRRPVDAPIVDWFRPPPNPYQAGNRGLEYGTVDGQVVAAVAAGTVTFAGAVGRSIFVVVTHDDGLRSTYGYVTEVSVDVGDEVDVGATVAVTGPGFHLTARRGTRYLDPATLLADRCRPVRLVPVPERHAGFERSASG